MCIKKLDATEGFLCAEVEIYETQSNDPASDCTTRTKQTLDCRFPKDNFVYLDV